MCECGVDFFGVSSIDEALNLRQGGIKENILVLGYTPPEHFEYLIQEDIVQSLVSLDYAKKLDEFARQRNTKIRCHCKVDTGMCRTGILYQDTCKDMDSILEEYRMENLSVEGIFSHFPVSDDLGMDSVSFTKHQIELFEEVIQCLKKNGIDPGLRHIQNSYGILNYQDLGMDYCRPGLLYMGVTSDDSVDTISHPNFIPILSWYANVSLVKTIMPGATVSYGRHFKATKPTKVATISVGYADGLPRLVSNKGMEVIVHDKRCKIIGNVCMDQCMVDVSNVDDVKEGDIVVLVGKRNDQQVTIDTISRLSNTINNETLSAIANRVPRLKKREG